MKRKLALLLALLALTLSACGYMVVEDSAVRVGSPSVKIEEKGR